jgi:peptidoglycan/xylan/chitin deacetylase (PgdA/CDA1 family)
VPSPAVTAPGHHRPLLLRASQLGDNEASGPRPLPEPDPVLRYGRPGLLPLSSVMRVATTDQVVSLTYDDGPNPEQTVGVLDRLAEHGARATFFVLTDRAQEHPEIIHRMLAEGHEVGLHGLDHSPLTELAGREALRRIRLGKRRLEAIIGRPVTLFRPTYGAIGMTAFIGARLSGLQVVIWTAWARDWFDAPVQEVADRAVNALHPGAIVLLHDTTDDAQAQDSGPSPTFSRGEVTERILVGARAAGYSSVTTSELLRRYPPVRAVTVQRPRLPRR